MELFALGSQTLIRNFSIQNRNLFREDTLNKYRVGRQNKLTGHQFVLIVEYIEAGHWGNKPFVAIPGTNVSRFMESLIFKKNEKESITFCTAKGHKMLTPAHTFGQIYQNYHDRDDKMLYLRLIRENSF